MSVALSKNGPVWSTDVNAALINLYLAVQQGWQPPSVVSEETYRSAKSLPDSDPLKAFCGFGCSFGGKWFGGYARGEGRNYASNCCGSLRATPWEKLAIASLDFAIIKPQPLDAVIYCDPPYAGTTRYAGAPPFDSVAFALRCAQWALFTDVFVSEYSFPIGNLVWEGENRTTCTLAAENYKTATERLYHLPKGSVWK